MKKMMVIAALGTLMAVSGCGKSENAGGTVKREARGVAPSSRCTT